jgi:DNA-binding MarR family transcriptional regulator
VLDPPPLVTVTVLAVTPTIALEGHSGITKTLLEASVRGKEKAITKAIFDLEKEGYITITPGKTEDGYRCKLVARTNKSWSPIPVIPR